MDVRNFLDSKVVNNIDMLNIVHINAQSLNDQQHYIEFCNIFVNSGVGVIAVSETFFKGWSDSDLHGYSCVRNDRTGKGGGGVAVYVKNGINFKILSMSPSQYSHRPEYIILQLTVDNVRIIFSCVYRPPKTGFFGYIFR